MKNNKKTIIIIIIVILLTLSYVVANTYAVIINVTSNEGINEIIGKVTIKDLLTDDNGNYNSTYYDVKNTLNVTNEEANILMNSNKLDEKLQIILKSVVEYKVNNNISARLSNEEIYNMIKEAVNNDSNISSELKNKVITKSSIYIDDVTNFLYNQKINVIEKIK